MDKEGKKGIQNKKRQKKTTKKNKKSKRSRPASLTADDNANPNTQPLQLTLSQGSKNDDSNESPSSDDPETISPELISRQKKQKQCHQDTINLALELMRQEEKQEEEETAEEEDIEVPQTSQEKKHLNGPDGNPQDFDRAPAPYDNDDEGSSNSEEEKKANDSKSNLDLGHADEKTKISIPDEGKKQAEHRNYVYKFHTSANPAPRMDQRCSNFIKPTHNKLKAKSMFSMDGQKLKNSLIGISSGKCFQTNLVAKANRNLEMWKIFYDIPNHYAYT